MAKNMKANGLGGMGGIPAGMVTKVTQGAAEQINMIAKNYKLIEQRFADNAEVLDEHSKALVSVWRAIQVEYALLAAIAEKLKVEDIPELPEPLVKMDMEDD
jgi:hypothetical protein